MKAAVGLVLALGCASPALAEGYVAGVVPSQRPANAPKIAKFDPPKGWAGWAQRGVSDPKPASLKFIDNQGAWYTPFTVRGMPGRYDIRGLHGMPVSQPGSQPPVN